MTDSSSKLVYWIIAAIAAVLVVAFGAVYFFLMQHTPGATSVNDPATASSTRRQITAAMRRGDFETVLSTNELIQNSENATAEQKAYAALNSHGAKYRSTGNIADLLPDVDALKRVVLNQEVSSSTRADALNVLAEEDTITNGSPEVIAEIYKDAPFSQYYVANDVQASARKLSEWSYQIYPTSDAAITIARWYVRQKTLNPSLAASTTKTYMATAQDYLKKADDATFQELRRERTYLNSTRYLYFRYMRTLVVSGLAVYVGAPYLSEYKDEFESFISFSQTQQNALAIQYRMYARLFYADRLNATGDAAAAKTQLDQLATDMSTTNDLAANNFFKFLKNEYRLRPNGANWTTVSAMMKISTQFKDAVTKVIAS